MLPGSAFEERTFHNADKSKSFGGEAVGYSSKSDTVTVLRDNGKEVKFKVSLLSQEEQTYIRENGVALAAASSTVAKLEEYKSERQSTRSDSMRSSVFLSLKG